MLFFTTRRLFQLVQFVYIVELSRVLNPLRIALNFNKRKKYPPSCIHDPHKTSTPCDIVLNISLLRKLVNIASVKKKSEHSPLLGISSRYCIVFVFALHCTVLYFIIQLCSNNGRNEYKIRRGICTVSYLYCKKIRFGGYSLSSCFKFSS